MMFLLIKQNNRARVVLYGNDIHVSAFMKVPADGTPEELSYNITYPDEDSAMSWYNTRYKPRWTNDPSIASDWPAPEVK